MIGQNALQRIGESLETELKDELFREGHYLTGALEESIRLSVNGSALEVEANHYIKWVNEGFPATSASWKQLPFMIEYFKKRGLPEKEAKSAAAATIVKWMKEGMPTGGSAAHSQNGRRRGSVEEAFRAVAPEIDGIIEDEVDRELNDFFGMGTVENI